MATRELRNSGGGSVHWDQGYPGDDYDLPTPSSWHCFGCSGRGVGELSAANDHARGCYAR